MPSAIIGGTGFYDHHLLKHKELLRVETTYGPAALVKGSVDGEEVFFLARHGRDHSLPPHRINYRANIAALRQVGVSFVLATAAVGTMSAHLPPGSFVVPDQFLDFTRQRALTFFEGGNSPVIHTDFSTPYCPVARNALLQAGAGQDLEIYDGACYVCTEGPRFETPAEIRMFQKLGGDIVGMTGLPEAVLAREAGLCYASIAIATNFAAGMGEEELNMEDVQLRFSRKREQLAVLLFAALRLRKNNRDCRCREAGRYFPEAEPPE